MVICYWIINFNAPDALYFLNTFSNLYCHVHRQAMPPLGLLFHSLWLSFLQFSTETTLRNSHGNNQILMIRGQKKNDTGTKDKLKTRLEKQYRQDP